MGESIILTVEQKARLQETVTTLQTLLNADNTSKDDVLAQLTKAKDAVRPAFCTTAPAGNTVLIGFDTAEEVFLVYPDEDGIPRNLDCLDDEEAIVLNDKRIIDQIRKNGVVTCLAWRLGRIEKSGIPNCATHSGGMEFLEDIQMHYDEDIHVFAHDTGEDGHYPALMELVVPNVLHTALLTSL